MNHSIIRLLMGLYAHILLRKPGLVLFGILIIIAGLTHYIPQFRLDASAESLILEHDKDLKFFRQISDTFGDEQFVVITYTPKEPLFNARSLNDLKILRDKLKRLENCKAVYSILDVPLLYNANGSLAQLADQILTLESADVDLKKAKQELLSSPLYRKQLISNDGNTTTLQFLFNANPQLNQLQQKRYEYEASNNQKALNEISLKIQTLNAETAKQVQKTIQVIRATMDEHRAYADLYLGGVPMITTDIMTFIRNDLVVFGIGVALFMIIALALIFHKFRWVMIPMSCCAAPILIMIGFLGWMKWPVTVISSNFIALLLIITLSLAIHLTVRYREILAHRPEASQKTLITNTIHLMYKPCLFTILTTLVAFCSLTLSDIRPVMDFGWMMTLGLLSSFLLVFLIFPTSVMLCKPYHGEEINHISKQFTRKFAHFSQNHGQLVLASAGLLLIFSIFGINKLSVDNRFIDYFDDSTEIYQGMSLIDKKLGGTTPLDIIINADHTAYAQSKTTKDDTNDDFIDDFSEQGEQPSYWFNTEKLTLIEEIHDYVDSLPETGKVLSLATLIKMARAVNNGEDFDDLELALMRSLLPKEANATLVDPYLSDKNQQIRLSLRIVETDPELKRNELLIKIREYLQNKLNLNQDQIHLTGMYVLYNNMLQSLFSSQILTISVVFTAIFIMFLMLFQSIQLALIGLIPNILPAGLVLGSLGILGIPLDFMTITIAAISVGIAVDNTIHYIHRFQEEFTHHQQYWVTVKHCHESIGQAIYFTSITVILGFTILALSNFTPTVYFGVFTSLAMLTALLATLCLLPKLIVVFKPLGEEIVT